MKIDEVLETDLGKNELAEMKRKNPPNKSPLFKLLGAQVGNNEGPGGEQSMESMQLDSIGCTANALIIDYKKKVYVANAGDSRSVLCRAGGKALALSEDHKPDNPEERARIEKAGSYISEGRVDGNLNLSRSLGDLKYKQNKSLKPEEQPISAYPDTKVVDLVPEDEFIIMGCDGIWEQKTNQEMVDFIRERTLKKMEPKQIVSELLLDIISPDYVQTCKFLISHLMWQRVSVATT